MAGQCEEDVVEIRCVEGDAVDFDRRTIELAEQRAERSDVPRPRDLQGECFIVAGGPTEDLGGRVESLGIGELEADVAARDATLQLPRRADPPRPGSGS